MPSIWPLYIRGRMSVQDEATYAVQELIAIYLGMYCLIFASSSRGL